MYDEVTDAKDMYLDAIPKQRRMILDAPAVIVAAYKPKTKISEVKRVYDLNGFASIWCAIENMKRFYTMDGSIKEGLPPRELTRIVKCVKYYSYGGFDTKEDYGKATGWFFGYCGWKMPP